MTEQKRKKQNVKTIFSIQYATKYNLQQVKGKRTEVHNNRRKKSYELLWWPAKLVSCTVLELCGFYIPVSISAKRFRRMADMLSTGNIWACIHFCLICMRVCRYVFYWVVFYGCMIHIPPFVQFHLAVNLAVWWNL